jgi:hypothetical protein
MFFLKFIVLFVRDKKKNWKQKGGKNGQGMIERKGENGLLLLKICMRANPGQFQCCQVAEYSAA